MASLQVIKGPSVGAVFELTAAESVMGRYPFCDVVLPSHTISRQHARIVKVENDFFVEDMNSLNGTFLNGERVRGRVQLKDQDRIRLYETLLLFHLKGVKPSIAATQDLPEAIARTEAFLPVGEGVEGAEGEAEVDEEDRLIAVVSALELRSGVCGGEQGQDQLRVVMQRMQAIGTGLELSELLAQVLEAMLEIFPSVERGHILLVQQPGGRLELKATKLRQDEYQTQMTLGPISQAVAKRVIARGEAVLMGAEADDQDSVFDSGAPSSMCAPLMGPSRIPLGILHLECGLDSQPFAESDLNVMVSVGMIAGQAIEFIQMLGHKSSAKPT